MNVDADFWLRIVTVVLALATFWKSLVEYRKQGASKRAEQFLAMRSRLRGNPEFVRICDLLEIDSPELKDLTPVERDNFTGFFEEVALLWNSRIFNDQVVYYMFGYFALKCARSSNFWTGLNRRQSTWDPFNNFVAKLERVEAGFVSGTRRYADTRYRL